MPWGTNAVGVRHRCLAESGGSSFGGMNHQCFATVKVSAGRGSIYRPSAPPSLSSAVMIKFRKWHWSIQSQFRYDDLR
jgi:hypothetical protein